MYPHSQGQAAEQQQKAQQEAMMKESMLTQILAPEAKTRRKWQRKSQLSRFALTSSRSKIQLIE